MHIFCALTVFDLSQLLTAWVIMFEIKPHALYSKKDLAEALKDICHVETFIRGVKPERILKGVYYGKDIIRAIDTMQRVNESGEVNPAAPEGPEQFDIGAQITGCKSKRGRVQTIPLDRILK